MSGCSTSTPPTWPARQTAAGGCRPIAAKARAAPASRSKIASRFRECCPMFSANAVSSDSHRTSSPSKSNSPGWRPRHAADPRIVLLSQAAGSTNYFEDAFLARYLGYTLAEAGDLAVRGNRLYLKSRWPVFRRVDVLLRRPNSEQLDPLEIADSGSQGTAGLLQAMRSGNVAIANSPGSGLVESPIFRAFLPRLAEVIARRTADHAGRCHLVVRRSERMQRTCSTRLDDLIILPAYRRRGEPVSQISRLAEYDSQRTGRAHSSRSRRTLSLKNGSSVPAHRPGAAKCCKPCYIALRTFAVAAGRQLQSHAWRTGARLGIARALGTFTARRRAQQRHLGAGRRPGRTGFAAYRGRTKSCRFAAAASIFPAVRRNTSSGSADTPCAPNRSPSCFAPPHAGWRVKSRSTAFRNCRICCACSPSRARSNRVTLSKKSANSFRRSKSNCRKSAFDDGPPGALRATVTSLTSLAATVRDLMSLDSWRIIRQMNDDFRPTPGRHGFLDLLDKIDVLLVQLAAYAGEIAESMTRTYAWRFLDLGRRLERGTAGIATRARHARPRRRQRTRSRSKRCSKFSTA